jgi:hypothetical protein
MVDWHAHKQVKTVDDSELKLKYFKLLLAGVRDRQSTKATIWSALVSHMCATANSIVLNVDCAYQYHQRAAHY